MSSLTPDFASFCDSITKFSIEVETLPPHINGIAQNAQGLSQPSAIFR